MSNNINQQFLFFILQMEHNFICEQLMICFEDYAPFYYHQYNISPQ